MDVKAYCIGAGDVDCPDAAEVPNLPGYWRCPKCQAFHTLWRQGLVEPEELADAELANYVRTANKLIDHLKNTTN